MDIHSDLIGYRTNVSEEYDYVIGSVTPDAFHDQQDLSTKVGFALGFITLAFALTGTVMNTVSVFVYTRRTMLSSMNILLAGLSAFDLAFSILSIPTFVVPPMCAYQPDQWVNSCHATTFSTLYVYPLCNVAKTGGVWTLVYITVQRWFTVRRPFRRARGSSVSLAKQALFAILAAAVVYNTPRFFEHRPLEDGQYPEEYVRVKPFLRRYPIYMSVYYSILYLLTHFVIPFTTLAFINGKMTCTIRRALKQQRLLSHSEKAAAMMATVVFVFVCCNTLPFIMNFVEFIDRDLWIRHETKTGLWAIHDISNILLLVGATSNAFIYYYCNRKYAQFLKRYVIEAFQLAKDRFDYPGHAVPTSRYRMVNGDGGRRPPRRRYCHRQERAQESQPFAVYTAKPDEAYCYLSPDTNRPCAAHFDPSPRCTLVIPDQPRNRLRSRSVLTLARCKPSGFRGAVGFGRSLSSTALSLHDPTIRFSRASMVFSTEPFSRGHVKASDVAFQPRQYTF